MNAFFMTKCSLSEIPICVVKKVALNTPENTSCKNAKPASEFPCYVHL